MSFWFIPTRTDPGDTDLSECTPCKCDNNEECSKCTGTGWIEWKPDLHPTDITFLRQPQFDWWTGGMKDSTQLGTKSDAYGLSNLLGKDFKQYINKWASPEVVVEWGERLIDMRSHLTASHYWFTYGKALIQLGNRGIGLILSW